MARWLTSLVARHRPPRGWAPLSVLLTALLCVPAAVSSIARQRPLETSLAPLARTSGALLVLTVLAALAGLRAVRTSLSRRFTLVLSVVLGLGVSVAVVGRLIPPFSTLWSDLSNFLSWMGVTKPTGQTATPFAATAYFVWRRLAELGTRLWWDVRNVSHGGPFWETQASVVLVVFVAWTVAFFSTWQIYREKAALSGLMPSGALLATLVLYYPGSALYLVAFLLCTLLLVTACDLWDHWDRWQATRTDYPDSLGLELALNLFPWIAILIVLAGLFPVRGFARVSRTFWEQVERVVGPLDGEQWQTSAGAGTLPRGHLIGAGPELGESIVFYVTTDDPAPPPPQPVGSSGIAAEVPRRYWRSETFDVYTGLGWTTSPLEVRDSVPESAMIQRPLTRTELWQHFELVASGTEVFYAANAPYWLDQAAQTWWRAPEDLVRIEGHADQYTVVSRIPEPSELELQVTPEALPLGVSDYYLELPEGVPRRVYDLAKLVVGDSESPFDKALALEAFLRTYTYTLEIPEPPEDRDLVDYFLFDLQQGYCDYYASAMVVLARAVGVPARLATGYAQGTFDYEGGRWIVTEQNAHSWVEIYFDGVGWVEFEPTASQPVPRRGSGIESRLPVVPPLPARPVSWWRRIPIVPLALILTLLVLIGAVLRLWMLPHSHAFDPDQLVRDRFARLQAWGARLGAQQRGGQTPHEYCHSLVQLLRTRAEATRWSVVKAEAADVRTDVESLTDVFVRTQYGPPAPSRTRAELATKLWGRLRRRLLRLWLRVPI